MGLRAFGVAAGYGGPPSVAGVDLEVEGGQMLAVAGPNGSGKTTLLRALAGSLPLSAGRVEVDGSPVAGMSARERARRIAVVPQGAPAEFAFTVREVVEMGRTPYLTGLGSLGRADRKAVEGALDRVRIRELADRDAAALSAGQAQLVSIARALAQEPRVLLLDEPTAHLDVTHQIEIMEGVQRLVREGGLAAVAVLHDLNLAATFADRILLLGKGRVRAQGPPQAVLTRPAIAATFGLDVLVRRHPVSGAFFVVPLAVALDPEASGAGPTRHGRVHLVCGGGSGAPFIDDLCRRGFEVSVGVVNVLDTDFEVATALGVRVVAEAPFSQPSPASIEEARKLVLGADAVVLCPVPFGPTNLDNLGLVELAKSEGKAVLIVDAAGIAARDFSGGAGASRAARLLEGATAGGAVRAVAAGEVLAALQGLLASPAPPAGR